MADWSDLNGLTLPQAKEKAALYDHEVATFMIEGLVMRPKYSRTKPTVMLSLDKAGSEGKVVKTCGVNQP